MNIGCGIDLHDALLFYHYLLINPDEAKNIKFYLCDKTLVTLTGETGGGYDDTHDFYNDMELAKQALCLAGILESNIYLIDADPIKIAELKTVDLILSLHSWGFHYPISVYLDPVNKILSPNGKIIIDIRRGKENGELENFQITRIDTQLKRERVVLENKIITSDDETIASGLIIALETAPLLLNDISFGK